MYFAFLSGSEMIFVLVAIVILFGATRIPQLGEALGKGIHNFRRAVSGKDDEKDPPTLQSGSPEQPKPEAPEKKA